MSKKTATRNKGARGAAKPRRGDPVDPRDPGKVLDESRDEKDVPAADQPGFGEEGMNKQRRAAQKEAEQAIGGKPSDVQTALEASRIERGRQIRGTGDMPAPVRGATHPVEGAGDYVGDAEALRQAVTDRYKGIKGPGIKVRATRMGYYDDKRRRTGDVFTIRPPYKVVDDDTGKEKTIDEFSRKWMVRVDGKTPERITTGKEDLKRQHDEAIAARGGRAARPRDSDRDVTGDDANT